MKRIADSTPLDSIDDFKQFNEHELAMVLGGGGDEQLLDFLWDDAAPEED